MSRLPADYEHGLAQLGVATLNALDAMEAAFRHLHPPELPTLRQHMATHRDALRTAVAAFESTKPTAGIEDFHARFLQAASLAQQTVDLFCDTPPPHEVIARVLASRHTFCRAQETLYGLHRLPPISRYFVEPAFHDRIEALDPEPPAGIRVGLLEAPPGSQGDPRHGGFCLYVPERYDGTTEWPLVVALHGGSGSGNDFVWTWLREARGRRFFLLAPTACGATWSMMGPDVDGPALDAIVQHVCEHWRVKRTSILLTGLSDGATYALLCGLRHGSPFTAIAPVSGTLHPAALAAERLACIAGRRIYLVHGARDWMFPIESARLTRDVLREAGADLVFREIDDLSHTYPREENDRILRWFDSSLALP